MIGYAIYINGKRRARWFEDLAYEVWNPYVQFLDPVLCVPHLAVHLCNAILIFLNCLWCYVIPSIFSSSLIVTSTRSQWFCIVAVFAVIFSLLYNFPRMSEIHPVNQTPHFSRVKLTTVPNDRIIQVLFPQGTPDISFGPFCFMMQSELGIWMKIVYRANDASGNKSRSSMFDSSGCLYSQTSSGRVLDQPMRTPQQFVSWENLS